MNKIEKEIMSLVWQGLYDCQDESSIQRGLKYEGYFLVWKEGKAYRVSVALDELQELATANGDSDAGDEEE